MITADTQQLSEVRVGSRERLEFAFQAPPTPFQIFVKGTSTITVDNLHPWDRVSKLRDVSTDPCCIPHLMLP